MITATDTLRTVAVLDTSQYLAGAAKMAGATERLGIAPDTSWMDKAAGGITLLGGALTGLGIASVAKAAQFQQQEAAFKSMLGAARGSRLFNETAQFTLETPFQLQDWLTAERTMLGFGEKVQNLRPDMTALGDVMAAMGRSGDDLQRAAVQLGEMQSSFASMRQIRSLIMDGVPAVKLLTEAWKSQGVTQEEIYNIGKAHISGQLVMQALLAQAIKDYGQGMSAQMQTLTGSVTSLKDNWNLFLNATGSPALAPLVHAVHEASYALGEFQKMSAGSQRAIGDLVLYGGPLLLFAGVILRNAAAYVQLQAAVKAASGQQATEIGLERDKIAVATQEAAALSTTATTWGKVGGAIAATAGIMGRTIAIARNLFIAMAAINTIQDLAAGKDTIIYNQGKSEFDPNHWRGAVNYMSHPGSLAYAFGHAFQSSRTDFEHWVGASKRLIDKSGSSEGEAAFTRFKPTLDNIARNWATVSAASVYKAASHLETLVENAQEYALSGGAYKLPSMAVPSLSASEKAAMARAAGMGKTKKGSNSPWANWDVDNSDIASDTDYTMFQIASMRHKAHPNDLSALKDMQRYERAYLTDSEKEIKVLQAHAAAIKDKAGKAQEYRTIEEKILSIMTRQQQMREDQAAAKQHEFVTAILSAGGNFGEDQLRKLGISPMLVAHLNKGDAQRYTATGVLATIEKQAQSFLKGKGGLYTGYETDYNKKLAQVGQSKQKAVADLSKRPIEIKVYLGNKEISTITSQVEDTVIKDLYKLLETGKVNNYGMGTQ